MQLVINSVSNELLLTGVVVLCRCWALPIHSQ